MAALFEVLWISILQPLLQMTGNLAGKQNMLFNRLSENMGPVAYDVHKYDFDYGINKESTKNQGWISRLHGGGPMSVPKGGYKRPNPVNVCPQKVVFFTSVAASPRLAF